MRTDINIGVQAKRTTKVGVGVPPSQKFELLANTFKTLGDYSRVRIVSVLVQGEKCPGEIALEVGLSPSAVSHHLKVLRKANLVKVRREHRQIFYLLDDKHIYELFAAGVEHVEELI